MAASIGVVRRRVARTAWRPYNGAGKRCGVPDQAIDRVLDALRAQGGRLHESAQTRGRWVAQCPAHEDNQPSLSIRQVEGQALLRCHAGCDTPDVVAELGLTMRDLFDEPRGATYRYTDAAGNPTRSVHRSPDKRFVQSGDKRLVQLYRLPKVIEAAEKGEIIYLVEGEKDVHAIEAAGGVATTAPMGADNFGKVDVSPLKGAHVIAIVDRDAAGQAWVLEVERRLTAYVSQLQLVEARDGKDAADHLVSGHGLDDFQPLAVTPPTPKVTMVSLADVQREHINWLWPGYLARGKLHVYDGDPGLGKSTASLDIVARITTGKPWPDGQLGTTPAGVVLLSAEDGLGDTIRPRLDAAGADVSRIVAVTGIPQYDRETGETYERMPALPGDLDRIRIAIQAVDAAVLIVDPLMAYLGGDVNSHRDQDVRRALAPLAQMADQLGVAVILVRHLSKSGGNNAIYRGGGSIGIIGAARLGFTFGRDPEDETRVIVACTKANITAMPNSLAYRLHDSAEHGCARVEWEDGPVNISATDLLNASHESSDDRADRNDAADWLRGYLDDNSGEAEAVDIFKAAEKVGISRDSIKRAKRRAGVISRKNGMDAGWMWMFDDSEESTKGAKGAVPQTLRSSLPSLLPSQPSDPFEEALDGLDSNDSAEKIDAAYASDGAAINDELTEWSA